MACVLQSGLNALHLAATGNHVEVVRALVGEFGLSVTCRDNVSYTLMCIMNRIVGGRGGGFVCSEFKITVCMYMLCDSVYSCVQRLHV